MASPHAFVCAQRSAGARARLASSGRWGACIAILFRPWLCHRLSSRRSFLDEKRPPKGPPLINRGARVRPMTYATVSEVTGVRCRQMWFETWSSFLQTRQLPCARQVSRGLGRAISFCTMASHLRRTSASNVGSPSQRPPLDTTRSAFECSRFSQVPWVGHRSEQLKGGRARPPLTVTLLGDAARVRRIAGGRGRFGFQTWILLERGLPVGGRTIGFDCVMVTCVRGCTYICRIASATLRLQLFLGPA